jgi:hypothetical protein
VSAALSARLLFASADLDHVRSDRCLGIGRLPLLEFSPAHLALGFWATRDP